MEEIARNIEKLIETLNENSIPNWITIVGLLGPIFISILVWWLSNRQNKIHTQLEQQINDNNDKLQRAISDQQIKAQMHGDFLKIYDDFCYAQSTINGAKNQVHIIFSNFTCYNAPNMPTQWSNSINNATNVITQALNRAKLLLPKSDQELRSRLELILEKYKKLNTDFITYHNSGQAWAVCNNAWNTIGNAYKINLGDYNALTSNYNAYTDFLKLCANETTEAINNSILEILSLFEYDKFDKYFEPYLQMNYLEKENQNGSN